MPVFDSPMQYLSPNSQDEVDAAQFFPGMEWYQEQEEEIDITCKEDYDLMVARLFQEKNKDMFMTLGDLLEYRIPTAYRLVRALAYRLDLLQEDERLSDIDPTTIQNQIEIPTTLRRRSFIDASPSEYATTSLWPPNTPPAPDGQDTPIVDYCRLLTYISQTLGMTGMVREDRFGLAGLTEPSLVRVAFPSYWTLTRFEDQLIFTTLRELAVSSLFDTYDYLRKTHRMQEKEARQLIQLARIKATEMTAEDTEEAKAIAILQFDELASQAGQALDPRAKIASLKNKSLIQGLTADTGDSTMKEFLKIAQDRSHRERKSVESQQVPAGYITE
jgi:hypothetical protein